MPETLVSSHVTMSGDSAATAPAGFRQGQRNESDGHASTAPAADDTLRAGAAQIHTAIHMQISPK